ncbi:epithelial cell adhesion molecule [Trichomycterus rosablanca]|uniref:epithelial cell adhesion molecule n=1 Tax=Trichomycterus rosablanca TaxID=2290929 RepID=UPI002F351A7D
MKALFALCLVAFIAGASAQCTCKTMKWATCDGTPCKCEVFIDTNVKQTLECEKLVPKCFLMKAEMYRAKNGLSTRTFGGKPVDTAIVDNDGIYDPVCENNGRFKAIQCNGTETCWCVNSAGVRRSDKGDKNLKCEPVETNWIRLELTHNETNAALDSAKLRTGLENAVLERYGLAKGFIQEVQYEKASRRILVDLKKSDNTDLATVAYYMEKDVKVLPLFKEQNKMEVSVEGNKVPMKNILIYYVDEKPPTMTMQKLTGGVIAVIVVVALAVVIGLLVLFFMNRREKAQYSKAQAREMDNLS